MKTRISLFLVLSLVAMSLYAQIRDYVPVVRPKYHAETVAFLEKLSASMEKDGYYDAAEMLKYYAKGGFGSGFVYVAEDGTDYVITNLHVVSQAESVILEFQQKDGGKTIYENCSVVAVDEKTDLALVAFPSGTKPFRTGLTFAAATVDDGAEVWSAGYPGLGGTPSWQLGKGNVSNGTARIPELADPDITFIIQHSAQVDPGNSGGPLLVEAKATAGYAVVGINTWKAFNRQATNFSIPASAIRAFLKKALNPADAKASQATLLESRCRGFAKLFEKGTDGYKDLAPYVSYAYVASDGEAVIKETLSVAPTKIRDSILNVFTEDSPVEGIRLAIAYTILSKASSGESAASLSFMAVDADADEPKAKVPVRFSLNGKEVSTSWTREHGLWRLTEYPLGMKAESEKEGKKDKTGVATGFQFDYAPYSAFFFIGNTFLSDSMRLWTFGVDFVPDTYVSYGLELGYMGFSLEDDGGVQFGANVRGQLPITNGDFSVLPYAGLDGGILFMLSDAMEDDSSPISTYAALDAGLKIGFKSFYLGGSYRYYLLGPTSIDTFVFTLCAGLGW